MPRPLHRVQQGKTKQAAPAQHALAAPARRVRLTLAKLAKKVGLPRLPIPEASSAGSSMDARSEYGVVDLPTGQMQVDTSQDSAAPRGAVHPNPRVCTCEEPSSDEIEAREWHFGVLYPSLCRAEQGAAPQPPAAARHFAATYRAMMVDWIIRRHEEYRLRRATLFLAVRLLDKFMSQHTVALCKVYLLGAAALLVASKFEDEQSPDEGALARDAGARWEAADMHRMEIMLLDKIDYRVHIPTAAHHLDWFLDLDGTTPGRRQLALYVVELGLQSPELAFLAPTHQAMAAAFFSGALCGRRPPLSPALTERCMTLQCHNIVKSAARVLRQAVQVSDVGNAVYDKYSRDTNSQCAVQMAAYVASTPVMDFLD